MTFHLNNEPFVTMEAVTLRVGGRWLLQGTNWRIRRGENWVVWGPNGSGKTTLAGALLEQVPVVAGFIHRHYRDNENPAGSGRPAMGLVSSQQFDDALCNECLLDEMRSFSGDAATRTLAGEWLAANRLAGGAAKDNAAVRAGKWLDVAGLLSKPITSLSSGEIRKLLLARALEADPELLILDEPFNGLDAAAAAELKQCLGNLMGAGRQVVLITHRTAEIPHGITHVLRLDNGRVAGQGTAADFLKALNAKTDAHVDSEPDRPAILPEPQRSCTPQAETLIDMRNVTVRYGRQTVLAGVDWQVNTGENWLLTGPNGAGKTTLLQVITGENLQGYANNVTLFGRRKGQTALARIRRNIGVVSDVLQAGYNKRITALEAVCSGFFDSVGLYRHCGAGQLEAARHWMERLELVSLMGERFDTLSFGQQRLVLIARAMVKSPRLLICDEPCNGLDALHRQRVLALLDRIGRQTQTPLLYVSHRPDEKPACITHHLHLANGRVAAIGRMMS